MSKKHWIVGVLQKSIYRVNRPEQPPPPIWKYPLKRGGAVCDVHFQYYFRFFKPWEFCSQTKFIIRDGGRKGVVFFFYVGNDPFMPNIPHPLTSFRFAKQGGCPTCGAKISQFFSSFHDPRSEGWKSNFWGGGCSRWSIWIIWNLLLFRGGLLRGGGCSGRSPLYI